jgi:hypothetical protein
MPRILILVLALAACRDGSPQRSPANGNDSSPSLVGAWDARLTLSKPYPLGLHERTTQIICGTIAFGENHHYAVASKDETSPDPGVYDLDLSSLGLAWIDDPPYPIAVAKLSGQAHNSGSSDDSVAIVLNPGSVERIVLLGHYDASGIDGRWTAQSARGTAAGSFSLTPHASNHAICDRPAR